MPPISTAESLFMLAPLPAAAILAGIVYVVYIVAERRASQGIK